MHPWGRVGLLEKSTAGSFRSSVTILKWQTIDCVLVCMLYASAFFCVCLIAGSSSKCWFYWILDNHFVYSPFNFLSDSPQNSLLAFPHFKGDFHIRSMSCLVNEAALGQPYIQTAVSSKYVF